MGVAGSGGNYDRHIYLDGAGKVWFGVYNGGDDTISTPTSYNDGSWHMAAATISSSGMALYVDGVLRGHQQQHGGRGEHRLVAGGLRQPVRLGVGLDRCQQSGHQQRRDPVNAPFLGSLDEATVYSGTALTRRQHLSPVLDPLIPRKARPSIQVRGRNSR